MSDHQDRDRPQSHRPKNAHGKAQQAPAAASAKGTTPKPKLGGLTLRPARKAPPSSNVDTSRPAAARPPTSSNVDTSQAHPAGRTSGSANVDTKAPGRPSANVDTSAAKHSAPSGSDGPNVDTSRAGRAAPAANSRAASSPSAKPKAPSPGVQRPVLSSLTFPGNSPQAGPKGKASIDPSKPPGPDPEIVARVKASKRKLQDENKELDQNVGAKPSLKSPSALARENTTVSKTTSSQYLNRGRMLINRYKRQQGIEQDYDDFSAKEFVAWLISTKPELKSSTWRVYRQAAYYTLMGKPDPDIDVALYMLDKDIVEGDETSGKRTGKDDRLAKKTSSMKEKKFPKADLDMVFAYLQYKSRSKMAPVLRDWLEATVHTGLRPIEWRATAFQTYRDPNTGRNYSWLYVLNAKATNARGNGVVRTLDLSDLPTSILAAIKRMSERGLEWQEAGRFDNTKSQVSQLLYAVGEDIFPRRKKHFSLYSCRHQFVANMKSVLEPAEVSALSGHVVTKTARESYGRAQSAWNLEDIGPHARPIPEEVATVQQSADFYEDRIENLKLAGVLHGNTNSEFPS